MAFFRSHDRHDARDRHTTDLQTPVVADKAEASRPQTVLEEAHYLARSKVILVSGQEKEANTCMKASADRNALST